MYSEGASYIYAVLVTINILILSSLFIPFDFNLYFYGGFIMTTLLWILNLFYFERGRKYRKIYAYFNSKSGKKKYNKNLGWLILLSGLVLLVLSFSILVVIYLTKTSGGVGQRV